MKKDHRKDSLADAWSKRLKNNRIIAAFFVVALILTVAASLTDSLDKLERFASRIWMKPEAPITVPQQSAINPDSPPNNEGRLPKRIEQTTTGKNSPAVADVQGDVIIQQQNRE